MARPFSIPSSGLRVTVFAALVIWLWPSWWATFPLLAYGVLYGSAADLRWHECGHGTAFKTRWMNDWVYQIASFMMMRNPTRWRWSHTRHHTDTLVVGLDPEIAVMRPPVAIAVVLAYVGILDVWEAMKMMLINASGHITKEEKNFIPEMEWPKVIVVARIWTLIYFAVIASCFYLQSILPLMLIGLPRLYGAWHHVLTGLMQHGGLADNVLDHRLNSRTVYINPISRFIYWNMNYHVEHHMFPMVPYHALPKLHEMVKYDLPAPTKSMWACYLGCCRFGRARCAEKTIFWCVRCQPSQNPIALISMDKSYSKSLFKIVTIKSRSEIMSNWIEACGAEEIANEDVRRFDHGDKTYALYRSPEDTFHATDGLCTHEKVHLCDGLVMDNSIECPKHNGRFNYKTGMAQGAPASSI